MLQPSDWITLAAVIASMIVQSSYVAYKFGILTKAVKSLEERMAKVELRLDSLENRVLQLEMRVANLETRVAKLALKVRRYLRK